MKTLTSINTCIKRPLIFQEKVSIYKPNRSKGSVWILFTRRITPWSQRFIMSKIMLLLTLQINSMGPLHYLRRLNLSRIRWCRLKINPSRIMKEEQGTSGLCQIKPKKCITKIQIGILWQIKATYRKNLNRHQKIQEVNHLLIKIFV